MLPRHAEFARRLATGEVASVIYRDLYPKSRAWKDKSVYQAASKLSANLVPTVQKIQQAAEDKTIADRREIMQAATQRLRGRMGDFVTAGADGVVPNVGPENINSISLKGLKSRCITTGEGDGKKDAVVTDIEIFDPLTGADMLNRMRKEYETGGEKDQQLIIILREAPRIFIEKTPMDVLTPKRIASHKAK